MFVEELLRRLRPILRERADELWRCYLAGDEEERTLIRQTLEILHAEHVDDFQMDKIVLTPPTKWEELDGQVPLGMVWHTRPLYPFALLERELTQHLGVFGRTGAGKSFLVRGLLAHLTTPVLVFDWKSTYRDAGQVFTPDNFSFNPLDLPHRRQVIELMLESYFEDLRLLTVEGVEYLLMLCLDALSNRDALTFHDMYQWMLRYDGRYRELDWKTSALNVLYRIISGPLGAIMRSSMKIEWLIRQRAVIELHHLGNKDRSFLIKTLLLWIYEHVQTLGPTSSLRLFIVLEEAHNILLRRSHESVIEMVLRQIREYGVGVCIVDQHPALISYPALGTYCTVAFNLRLRQDRDAMASALCLKEDYLGRLPPRFAIVKIQDRFISPFLIKTFDYKPGVVRVVRKREEDIRDLSEVLRPYSRDVGVIRRVSRREVVWEEVFLVHVCIYPLLGSVARYRRLGLNSYQGNKIKKSLLEKGLIAAESVSTPAGRLALMVPTGKGFHFLKLRGFCTRSDKDGGIDHQYWKRRLRDRFSALGYVVDVEVNYGRDAVDLVVANGGRKVSVEIETGKNHREQVTRNILKGLAYTGRVVAFLLQGRIEFEDERVAVVSDEPHCIAAVKEYLGDAGCR